jgi:4-alpha-glucanotransferase
MNPVRAWWEEDRQVTEQFWQLILGNQGEAPYFCEPWICRQILDQHLWSPAMLTVLPLQDWLSMDGALRRLNPNDERINVPANSRHYWRYRMHLTVEQLAAAKEFNDTLTDMIASSGRK